MKIVNNRDLIPGEIYLNVSGEKVIFNFSCHLFLSYTPYNNPRVIVETNNSLFYDVKPFKFGY